MTTAMRSAPKSLPKPTVEATEGDQSVNFGGIGWPGYEDMLRLRGDRARPRLIYLDGDVLLMSPGHSHERDKDRFLVFVVALVKALRMRYRLAGSTTYRRRKDEAGLEPDQSFYLANQPLVAGKTTIDLNVDPPPDLSIEIVYSHAADAAIEVSRRLGIPEVWVSDDRGLRFLVLGEDREYVESTASLAFPILTPHEVLHWIRLPDTVEFSDLEWEEELAVWIRETLLPRTRAIPD